MLFTGIHPPANPLEDRRNFKEQGMCILASFLSISFALCTLLSFLKFSSLVDEDSSEIFSFVNSVRTSLQFYVTSVTIKAVLQYLCTESPILNLMVGREEEFSIPKHGQAVELILHNERYSSPTAHSPCGQKTGGFV